MVWPAVDVTAGRFTLPERQKGCPVSRISLKIRQVRMTEVEITCDDSAVMDWIENALNDSFADETKTIADLLEEAQVESQSVEVERTY